MTVWARLGDERTVDLGSYIGLQRLRRLYVTCTANYIKSQLNGQANPELVLLEQNLRDVDRSSPKAKAKLLAVGSDIQLQLRLFTYVGAATIDYELLQGKENINEVEALWARLYACGYIGLAYFVVHQDNGGKWKHKECKEIAIWLERIGSLDYLPENLPQEKKTQELERLQELASMFAEAARKKKSVRLG